ncbi:hypothetical protein TBLA_0A00270 [Henningerozyma blattae CBS 6284]|uniref:Uncharacterized protein n=1 Tax=Henningerozyma blattae (strain ATCC 34711 / CBS 6284 / DSM 70876 / NBRC 10599 / NRRL Y-10934 / UCD 77-7) TaxID=1071380 RepID=I2GUM6_HENB6|nr:hypothetical protein TBLA_0A00270 [Tetrapisispora blattae CBS 6284]CCH57828.1 hypothetical protein TBLA_0A00270 [Tetrapisispora blattae CBS 6284]
MKSFKRHIGNHYRITTLICIITFYFISHCLKEGKDPRIYEELSDTNQDSYLQDYIISPASNWKSNLYLNNKLSNDVQIPDKTISKENTKLDWNARRKLLKKSGKPILKSIFQKLIISSSSSGQNNIQLSPNCPIKRPVASKSIREDEWEYLTFNNLNQCLIIDDTTLQNLKTDHQNFLESLNILQDLPINMYYGKGIVLIGGGKNTLFASIVAKFIRDQGNEIPVEIFIPPTPQKDSLSNFDFKQSESDFCNKISKELNTNCIFISDIIDEEDFHLPELTESTTLLLALLTSSFDDTLVLSPKNFPLKPLDTIFQLKPYPETGFISWPGFWRRAIHPSTYDIMGKQINFDKRIRMFLDDITPPKVYTSEEQKNATFKNSIPLHDLEGTLPDPVTSGSQFLIKKSKNIDTILLALYYSVNGPSWYYILWYQKISPHSSKDELTIAAHILDKPFYQVKATPFLDGIVKTKERPMFSSTLYHDFQQDFAFYTFAKMNIKSTYDLKDSNDIQFDPSYTYEKFSNNYMDVGWEAIRNGNHLMFAHSNLFDGDPKLLKNRKLLIDDISKEPLLMTWNIAIFEKQNIELESFKTMHEYLCEKAYYFDYLEDEYVDETNALPGMCLFIKQRLDFLQSSADDAKKTIDARIKFEEKMMEYDKLKNQLSLEDKLIKARIEKILSTKRLREKEVYFKKKPRINLKENGTPDWDSELFFEEIEESSVTDLDAEKDVDETATVDELITEEEIEFQKLQDLEEDKNGGKFAKMRKKKSNILEGSFKHKKEQPPIFGIERNGRLELVKLDEMLEIILLDSKVKFDAQNRGAIREKDDLSLFNDIDKQEENSDQKIEGTGVKGAPKKDGKLNLRDDPVMQELVRKKKQELMEENKRKNGVNVIKYAPIPEGQDVPKGFNPMEKAAVKKKLEKDLKLKNKFVGRPKGKAELNAPTSPEETKGKISTKYNNFEKS